MKFQNTLLTATAICYYVLLFSQPADSSAARGLSELNTNDGVYYHRKPCNYTSKCTHPELCVIYKKHGGLGFCVNPNDGLVSRRKECIIDFLHHGLENVCIRPEYENDMSILCRPRDCGNLSWCSDYKRPLTCPLTILGYSGPYLRGYIQPSCNSDRSCSNKNHKCVMEKSSHIKFCVQMTDEDWNELSDCDLGFCGTNKICHSMKDSTSLEYCIKS